MLYVDTITLQLLSNYQYFSENLYIQFIEILSSITVSHTVSVLFTVSVTESDAQSESHTLTLTHTHTDTLSLTVTVTLRV